MLQLLATDFDGTSVGFTPNESCVDALALALEKINDDGILWSICTGRDFLYLLEGLEYFNPPIQPHYIITSERYLYSRDKKKGWQAFADWNRQCDFLHEELFKKNGLFFEEVKNLMLEYEEQITFLDDRYGIPETLLTKEEGLLNEIVLRLLSLPHSPRDFSFQRTHTHLRFCHIDFDKGRVVRELTRFLSLKSENVLAIGDHYNDLTMLNSCVASMLACPSNAHDEVKAAVQKTKGYISKNAAGKGTAEGIQFYHQKTKLKNQPT